MLGERQFERHRALTKLASAALALRNAACLSTRVDDDAGYATGQPSSGRLADALGEMRDRRQHQLKRAVAVTYSMAKRLPEDPGASRRISAGAAPRQYQQ